MLELAADDSRDASSQFQPPKYISLRGTVNTIGRGYQANIRMPFKWLSRKHATITRVDGNCIIEAYGYNGVFVNNKQIEFTTLSEGDIITFGGGTRNTQIGSVLSSSCGPCISYFYHKRLREVDDTGNWYHDPTSPEDIIQVDDIVNGQNVTRVYHLEDFNCTDDEDSVSHQTPSNTISSTTAVNNNDSNISQSANSSLTTNCTASTSGMESENNVEISEVKTVKKNRGKGRGAKASKKNCVDLGDCEVKSDNKKGKLVRRQLRQTKSMSHTASHQETSNVKSRSVALDSKQTEQLETAKNSVECGGSKSDNGKEEAAVVRGLRKRKRLSYVLGDESDSDENYSDAESDDSMTSTGQQVTKKLKLASAFQSFPKGKGKSIAGRLNKKKGKQKAMDKEELQLIEGWYNKAVTKPASRMVEIWNGAIQRELCLFNDVDVFQVIYKTGRNLNDGDVWCCQENDVIIYLDAALFEYKVKLGLLPNEDLKKVLELVKMSTSMLTISDYDQPTPAAKVKPVSQPKAITVPLKQYQLDTLGWMYHLELEVNKTWTVSKLVDWPEAEVDAAFDMINKRVFFPPVPSVPSTTHKINIKGGILADEMGLGKTLTVLSLIVTNQDTESPIIPSPTVFRNGQAMHLLTKATLVIAPSHLTSQWKEEAEKHAPGLNVILITTKPQFEKYTYVDILLADLVIVSVQFLLTNKTYTALPSGVDAELSFMHLIHKPNINPLLEKCPNLGHFNWWRLVCDEAHELITYKEKHRKHPKELPSSGLQMLENLTARHKWYMTGTPLPHKEKSLRGALKFLEMKLDDRSLMYDDGSLKIDEEGLCFGSVHKFILDTIYVRNTKQSVGKQYNVPEYTEELLLLTMSDVERGIYESASNQEEKRQLCCHLQIAARVKQIAGIQQKSLDEVKDAMIAHTKLEIHKHEFWIAEAKLKLDSELAMAVDNLYNRDDHKYRIKQYQEKIASSEDAIKKLSASLSYFENIAPRITQSADEPCVICLDNIVRLTVTPCGHLFCRNCIVPCVQQQEMCPTCRKHIAESELVEVKDPNQRENLNRSAELQKLTEQFGTKMAYLIFYLRYLFKSDPNSRVIIFSQWDELLHKIGSTLNEHGIRNVFVKGNVHVRNKAISSFRKQEKTRVIMLSLQNAASGTNLVEASHVILIDPVAGSKEEARAIEAQAIGRAHRMGQDKEITVVRMIVKDTIEHELYLRNNSETIQQMELEIDEDPGTIGVQVIRKVRKVPKPEIALANTSSVFAVDDPSTSGITGSSSVGYRPRARAAHSRRHSNSRNRANATRFKIMLAMQRFWLTDGDGFL